MTLEDFLTQAKLLTEREIETIVYTLQDHLQELDRERQLAKRKYGRLALEEREGKPRYVVYDEHNVPVYSFPKRGAGYYAAVIWDERYEISSDNFSMFTNEETLNKALGKYSNMAPLICKMV